MDDNRETMPDNPMDSPESHGVPTPISAESAVHESDATREETPATPDAAAGPSPWGLVLACSILGTLCQTGQALVPVLRQVFGQRLPYAGTAVAYAEAALHYGFALGCIAAIGIAGRLGTRAALTISAAILAVGGGALAVAVTQERALPLACGAFALASGFLQPAAFAALVRAHGQKTCGVAIGTMAMLSGVIGAVVAFATQRFAPLEDGFAKLLNTTAGIVAGLAVLGWLFGRWVIGSGEEAPHRPGFRTPSLALSGILAAAAAMFLVALYQNVLYSKNVPDTGGFRTASQFSSFGLTVAVAGLLRTLGGGFLSDLAGRVSPRARLGLLAVTLTLCAASGSLAALGKAPQLVLAVFVISLGLAQGVMPGAIAASANSGTLTVWFGAVLLMGPLVNEFAFWARLPAGYVMLPAVAAALLLALALRTPRQPALSQ